MLRPRWRWIAPFALLALLTGAAPAKDAPSDKPKVETSGKKKAVDPNLIMLDHVDAVFQILADHKDDCDKAVGLAVAYVQTHKKELLALRAQAEKMEKSLCPKARKKYDKKIRDRASKMGERYTPTMFELYNKCPDHIDRLQEAMMFLGSKCKEN